MKCTIFFPAIFALLIITSCKKYQPDNVVTNCGNWVIGDSMIHATTFGGSLNGPLAILEFLSDSTANASIVFNYGYTFFPGNGVYAIDTNQIGPYFTISALFQNQLFRSYISNANVTIGSNNQGNPTISVPSMWLYAVNNNDNIILTDSIKFSGNLVY